MVRCSAEELCAGGGDLVASAHNYSVEHLTIHKCMISPSEVKNGSI